MTRQSKLTFVVFCLIFNTVQAGERPQSELRSALLDVQSQHSDSQSTTIRRDFSSYRYRTAVLMSVIVPGTGQTFLGYSTKGAALSLLAISGLVGGYVFQSDITSNNQRSVDVQGKYSATGNYTDSDAQYRILVTLRDQSKRYETRRNIFVGIAATAWALSIADILFYSEDLGGGDVASSAIRGSVDVVSMREGAALRISITPY